MRINNFARDAMLVFAGLVIGLAICEAGLRLTGFSYPAWEVRDPDLGFVTLAVGEGRWTTEGNGYVRFNAYGFRDRERDEHKADGT